MATEFNDTLTGTEGADFIEGLSGADTLLGLTGNDLLYGGADNDWLEAGDDIDQLYGGSGKDALYGGNGNDKLDGGSDNDLLFGENGNDTLWGGDGNDTINGGAGTNVVYGELGNDRINNTDLTTAVSIYGGAGDDTIRAVAITYFVNKLGGVVDAGDGNDLVEDYTLSNWRGTNQALQIRGGDGNDTIRAMAYAEISGGTGDDRIVMARIDDVQLEGEYGMDWMQAMDGGSGHDIFYLDSARGQLSESSPLNLDWTKITGFEEIVVRALMQPSNEPVILTNTNLGEDGNLTVRTAGEELPQDASWNDLDFSFRDVGNTIEPDTLYVDGSAVTLGHLTLTGTGTLLGGSLSDTISGNGLLSGNGGDDLISGFGTLVGGEGNDVLTGLGNGSTLDGGAGDDSITAGGLDDSILGGDGNDLIKSGSGENRISGGAGDDTIIGGTGTDTVIYAGVMADYTITDDFGTLTVTGPEGTDTLTGINFIQFADQTYAVIFQGITIIGTGDPDYIDGSDGNDSLSGGAGNDTLTAGAGNDVLVGGAGSDSLDGGGGIDLANYVDASSGVIVDLTTGIATGGAATVFRPAPVPIAKDSLADIENVTGSVYADTLTGNIGDNALNGAAGGDSLSGAGGRDSLLGGAGNDILFGVSGNDTLDGQDGFDTLLGGAGNDTYIVAKFGDIIAETIDLTSLTDSGGRDTILSAISFNLSASAGTRFVENLSLTGTGQQVATGNDLANVLTGNDGLNKLYGGLGNDTLAGGLGFDECFGGAGNDVFVFNSSLLERNLDRVQDYEVGTDRIRLEDAVFVGLETGRLRAVTFVANSTGLAEDSDDRVMYESDTGRLFYDADGTGAGARAQFGTLASGLALSNLDFLVV